MVRNTMKDGTYKMISLALESDDMVSKWRDSATNVGGIKRRRRRG